MDFHLMTYEQASNLSGFFYPRVLQDNNAERFWFLCISDSRGILGCLALDPLVPHASLKSISISPIAQREGLATQLLRHALDSLAEAGITLLSLIAPLPIDLWETMEPLLEKVGFVQEGTETFYYKAPLGTLAKESGFAKMRNKLNRTSCTSLSQLTPQQLNQFKQSLVEDNVINPDILDKCDPTLSQVYLVNDSVVACLLLEEETDGGIELVWAFQFPQTVHPTALACCFIQGFEAAESRFDPDTLVWVSCINEKSDKLLCHLWPSSQSQLGLRTYHCLTTPPPEEPFSPEFIELEPPHSSNLSPEEMHEFKPNLVDGSELVCFTCQHRLEGKILSCQKFLEKPNQVIYGEDCVQFSSHSQ